jgi:hypothetical protein
MDILLDDVQDISFAHIAQGARVDGATLPSGLKVPKTSGMKWIIEGQKIRCMQESNNKQHVRARFPE